MDLKKKCLVLSIDQLKIKSVHEFIEILFFIAYISNIIFWWSLEDKYIIDINTVKNYCIVVQ